MIKNRKAKRTAASIARAGLKKGAALAPKKKTTSVRARLGAGGELHVRHMSDECKSLLLTDRVVMGEGLAVPAGVYDTLLSVPAGERPKRVWVQVARTGTYRGHPTGPFELNNRIFGEMIQNFKATENQAVPIDFEHASEVPASQGSIATGGAPAQGWIYDLKIEGTNMFGLVEWNPKAAQMIRDKEYKFISPAIRFGAKDRQSGRAIGAYLKSAGLTNEPFLDGMQVMAAKDAVEFFGEPEGDEKQLLLSTMAYHPNEFMPRIKGALKLNDLSTCADCSDHLDKLRDHFDAAGGDSQATHEGVKLSDYLHPLRDMAGGGMNQTWDEVLDTIEELISQAQEANGGDGSGEAQPPEADLDDNGDGGGGDDGGDGDGGGGDDDGGGDDTSSSMKDGISQAVPAALNAVETEKEIQMSAEKIKELEATIAANALVAEKAKTEKAQADLQLKDAEAKLEAANKTVALKDAEVAAAKVESDKRDEKDRSSRVGLAFSTYKDAKKLSDSDKEGMLLVLTHKPEVFEKMYPVIDANKTHLLSNLTGNREGGNSGGVIEGNVVTLSVRDAAKKIAEDKGISLADAQCLVVRMAAGQK